MRTSDLRYPTSNENSNVRFSSHFQFLPQQHNQTQNIYYQTPVAIPISPQIANGSHLNNYSLYPQIYQIPNHQQIMMSGNQQLLISMPSNNSSSNISDNASLGNISTIDSSISSSVTSPQSMTPSQNQFSINYTVNKWHEISVFYDGNVDERPSAGQLKNGKYFTQRSAGKDIYMVFNSISDYINNFVNYYFSNKNFSTDEKLFNLMDESGCVALKDLIKFPRLAHIGTTVEDIIEALKYNNFVKVVNLKSSDIKAARRIDGWFPNKLIDDSHSTNASPWLIPITGNEIATVATSSSIYGKKPLSDIVVVGDLQTKNKLFFGPLTNSVTNTNNVVTNGNGTGNGVVLEPSAVVISPQPSHHSAVAADIVVNPTLIDTGVGSNSLIYFNPPSAAASGAGNAITHHHQIHHHHHPQHHHHHQSIYPPSAFIHGGGLHQIQSPTAGGHLLTPANPAPSLILHAQHYPATTFYPQNQSFHLRQFWPGQNITDLGANPILYTSTNNNHNHNNISQNSNGNISQNTGQNISTHQNNSQNSNNNSHNQNNNNNAANVRHVIGAPAGGGSNNVNTNLR